MKCRQPKFVDSEYFVCEVGNWHLKEGAPKEIREEFDKWVQAHEEERRITREYWGKIVEEENRTSNGRSGINLDAVEEMLKALEDDTK